MTITTGGKKRIKVVVVSGGFDPLHIGHVRLFHEAKKLGERLVVILNNDNWLRKKKGFVFMPQSERKELIGALASVDRVVLTSHPSHPEDMSVCNELQKIKPDIFAKGGDRTAKNIPETPLCHAIGCKVISNVGHGGKVQSSSRLLQKYLRNSHAFSGISNLRARYTREWYK